MHNPRGKAGAYYEDQQIYGYVKAERNPMDEEHDCWASDSGSSSGSYYSNTSSSAIEWESEVSPWGEVFYIESYGNDVPLHESFAALNCNTSCKTRRSEEYGGSPAPELTRRRSTRAGKLLRLLRRRESYRHSVRMSGLATELRQNQESISKVNRERESRIKGELKLGERYSVCIRVDPDRRHKLGRRASACEAYLGIVPSCIAADDSRIIVAGFVPDGEALKTREIKVGDWLQTVNSKDVGKDNVDSVLTRILTATNITCQFQRTCLDGNYYDDNYTTASTTTCPNQSALARQLVDKEESAILMESLVKESLGVICTRTSGFTDADADGESVLYTFPRSKTNNVQSFLSASKGAFVTLNHLLPEILGGQPVSTSVSTQNGISHVVYFSYEDELLLIALPEKCCSKEEALELSTDIVCTLTFTNSSIRACFSNEDNHSSLDHFFYLFFAGLYKDRGLWGLLVAAKEVGEENPRSAPSADDTTTTTTTTTTSTTTPANDDFSHILAAANFVQLPRDAQIQIDAALSEMEAMDYRDWNQDPMECQRLYTIVGSCLYHRRHLLGSHLPADDLIQIHSFLRRHGLLALMDKEQVKSLVVWKRVYPTSSLNRKLQWEGEGRGAATTCTTTSISSNVTSNVTSNANANANSNAANNSSTLTDRWFLLVVGYGHNLLALLLESGGCTAILEEHSGPDIFYVEEAQETLKHIRKIGISALAEKWMNANAKPEVVVPKKESPSPAAATRAPAPSIAENLVGLIKTTSQSRSSATGNPTKPGHETVTAHGKSRACQEDNRHDYNNGPGNVAGHPIETTRRDSPSQDSLSQVSEMSDQAAPILGRRATRERSNNAPLSRYSDESSVSELDNEQSAISENINSIRENLLHQAEYIVPKVITTGSKNSLVYYVHIDLFDGVLISSRVNDMDREFLSNLNAGARAIHKVLSDTKRYKKLLSHEAGKSVINKNLIAIKEHGILMEWENTDYWIVGRLYSSPRPKELYICYEDSAPQNLIEMAFRLQAINH